ncbi:P2Y purinoceptor 1-like [Xiphophorus hellerii]|uniref:P2Y purinoceptor 1-like n=1 Tax=Xiphophorus hellerii TaxID=8084 RepID=UPI0013B3664D|nr:P2Y purinoceptor 1-like [Xiphophorus hellerii]
MTTTNITKLDLKSADTFLTALYILVFVVGLVLNLCGMKCLVHNWKKLRIINILVLNLGVADMLYLLTHPFLIVYYINKNEWTFGDGLCKVTRFCFNLNLYGSIGFLTCISVYRYLVIVHPLRVMGRLTMTQSVVISVVMWVLASVISFPDMSFPKDSMNSGACYDTTDSENIEEYLIYSLCWTFIGFCIPFIVIVCCYGHVILVVCRSNMMNVNQKQQILKLLVFLILMFLFCYAPFHVSKNLNLYSRVLTKLGKRPTWNNVVFKARHVSFGLVSLNSAVNPLVYLCVSEDVGAQCRQLLQQMFSCCFKLKSRSEPVPQTEKEALSAL